MSHEIESNDTVVFGSNTPAWHGLGTVFAGLLSPLRVFAEGVGHRDILEVPVVIGGLTLPDKKGLVGIASNGVQLPLAVVGSDYGVLKSQSMYEILDGVYGGQAVVDAAGTLRNGAREWCLVKREAWSAKKGDTILTYDLWLNHHDGSGCFGLHRTNVRVVCANTWKLAVSNGNRVFGVRHTKNVNLGVEEALRVLGYVEDNEQKQRAVVQRLACAPMSRDNANRVFSHLVGIEEGEEGTTRAKNQLTELNRLFTSGTGNEGQTRWDAFNAVTEFVDHSRATRVSGGRNADEVRFESVLMGSGDAIKAQAYAMLTVGM
jgi:phage/plasmid-like protein (TIGR03299 family)